MTIAAAWTRNLKGCHELVLVTDSRLSGDGRTFDACTKVITLPREDCAIAFAGFSGHGYPMMQQVSQAIDAHAPLKRGSLDVVELKSHILKIFDGMADSIKSSERVSSPTDITPEAEFIFGGYSWKSKEFKIWHIRYSRIAGRFEAHPPASIRKVPHVGGYRLGTAGQNGDTAIDAQVVFIGDQAKICKKLFLELLNTRDNLSHLDMEPFEVIRDMLRSSRKSETIGGSPQIVKVYQYMKSAPLGVFWPDKGTGRIHLHGRKCLGYERIDRWIIDPDTLQSQQADPISDLGVENKTADTISNNGDDFEAST